MIDTILAFKFNTLLSVFLYWIPLCICICTYGYLIRNFYDIQEDKKNCESQYYHPKLTIGVLIGRGIVSTVPIANLLAAIFDLAPEIFGRFFKWIGRVFDQPIISNKYRKDLK